MTMSNYQAILWKELRRYKKFHLKRGVRVRNIISKREGIVTRKYWNDPEFIHVEILGKKDRPDRERFVVWFLPNIGLVRRKRKKT